MRRILFGHHAGWSALIARHIDPMLFDAHFGDPADAELGGFDAVLPLRVEHYAPVRAAVAAGIARAIVPCPEVAALCEDKLALTRFFLDRGFSRHFPCLYDRDPVFPCIVKPRRGEFGAGCRVIHAPEPIAADTFAQELIAGEEEYALHALRAGGRIRYLGATGYRMAAPATVRGAENVPLRRWQAGVDVLAPLVERLLGELDFEGTCCINFKLRDRVPLIFEINPRFGGSLTSDVTRYATAYCEALGI